MSGGAPTAVPSLLKRIVQTFFILATPPLCYLPPNDVLKDLDSIIQCKLDSTRSVTKVWTLNSSRHDKEVGIHFD